jgi:hypothetical protein
MRPKLTSPQDEFENEYLSSKFPLAIDPSHVARRNGAGLRFLDGGLTVSKRLPAK